MLELIESGISVHCLRDLTRGGLASGLVEIAEAAWHSITFEESAASVRPDVTAASELLGLDPLHAANKGRFIAFVPSDDAQRALAILRRHSVTASASLIGEVAEHSVGTVSCRSAFGTLRVINMLSGEQLPRIC